MCKMCVRFGLGGKSMPKGKNFDAAEKHFEKKCITWRKTLREAESENATLKEKSNNLLRENTELKEINKLLEERNSKLMELNSLSELDLKRVIATAENESVLSGLFGILNKHML